MVRHSFPVLTQASGADHPAVLAGDDEVQERGTAPFLSGTFHA
jgi:hypothetical protein